MCKLEVLKGNFQLLLKGPGKASEAGYPNVSLAKLCASVPLIS